MLPVVETSKPHRLDGQRRVAVRYPDRHSGGGWFADSTVRGQSSTLTAEYLLDLQLAQNPELTFWQRVSLTGVT